MSASENQIVVYQPNETVRLDVRLENETVWLNRHQMAQLFGRDVKTIGKHIANALSEELACVPVVSDFAPTRRCQVSTVSNAEVDYVLCGTRRCSRGDCNVRLQCKVKGVIT